MTRLRRPARFLTLLLALPEFLACPQLLEDRFSIGAADAGPDGGDRVDAGSCSGPRCARECPRAVDAASVACLCEPALRVACSTLRATLIHRYRFEGRGTQVLDSVGDGHGTVVNTELSGDGAVDLAGGSSDQYVELPGGLISGLRDATLETWLVWAGGSPWQRVFDLGTTYGSTGQPGNGSSYLFLTPKADLDGKNLLRVVFSDRGLDAEVSVQSPSALPVGVVVNVALVVDAEGDRLLLYRDGALQATVPFSGSLADIDDRNDWLGRSQFAQDPSLSARLLEFRIYAAALGPPELEASFRAGPDSAFPEP